MHLLRLKNVVGGLTEVQREGPIEEYLYIAYVSSALRRMYSKTAKAAMHEIPWNAKPTLSSESVISADTLRRQKPLSSLENPGTWIIGSGDPKRRLTNPAARFSGLGCAEDAIANFPPTLEAGPRRRLRRGPAYQIWSQVC